MKRSFLLNILFLFMVQSLLFGMGSKEMPLFTLIPGEKIFSPNGDGIQDLLILSFQIDLRLKSSEGYIPLLSVEMINDQNEKIRTLILQEPQDLSRTKAFFSKWKGFTLHRQICWDGKNDLNEPIPDGQYHAEITLMDGNGNKISQIFKDFIIDNSPPELTLFPEVLFSSQSPQKNYFSPDGDKENDLWSIKPSGSIEAVWEERIIAPSGKVMKAIQVRNASPPPFFWDGTDDKGEAAPDGTYLYEIEATDSAGNRTFATLEELILDRKKSILKGGFSSLSLLVKNPKNKILFTPILETSVPLKKWEITLIPKGAKEPVLFSQSNKELPQTIEISPQTLKSPSSFIAEGSYNFFLNVELQNGTHSEFSQLLYFDTTPTLATVRLPPWKNFTPSLDGNASLLEILQEGSEEAIWEMEIQNEAQEVLFSQVEKQAPLSSFYWNGLDQQGAPAPDGLYSYHLRAKNPVGEITFDQHYDGIRIIQYEMGVEAQYPTRFLNPQRKEKKLAIKLHYQTPQEIISWSGSLYDSNKKTIQFAEGASPNLPSSFFLSSPDEKRNPLSEGDYHFKFQIRYSNGQLRTVEEDFKIDTSAPVLKVTVLSDPIQKNLSKSEEKNYRTIEGMDLSGFNNWQLEVKTQQGKLLRSFTGDGDPSFQIVWQESGTSEKGKPYHLELKATDLAGNTAFLKEAISTSIFAVKKEEHFYLMIPNILFAAYSSDFHSVEEEQYQISIESLEQVKKLFDRYPQYQLTIEGHGLNLYTPHSEKWKREEKKVMELTLKRAESIKQYLVEKTGFQANRIQVQGLGSQSPLFSPSDFKNNEKNRRVEFIMIPHE